MSEIRVSHGDAQDMLDGMGEISEGVQLPKDFIGADGNFEAPSVEKILQALEGMQGLSLEDREALKTQLLQQQMRESYGDDEMENSWGQIPADSFLANQTFVLLSLLCIIAFVFVFFGLKLYRSVVEKERKREEKRKLKMQKKKK
ncbi:uncharacterized protein LOC113208639 [Frankliniella occidentalis]|uniref:Uncharacterized protein LOC113208639 n=1 Tax=Frankliniella occidentalis TaxID=133901 RepID=A0A6J1SKQ9_FRAOC|nr:uncharacterized protein LOC113208639 [Frankliniella occidentalis]